MSEFLAALLLVGALALDGQSAPPRYLFQMLQCAAFREVVRSDIRNQTGTILRQETAGRDGLLVLRGSGAPSGLALEAWYDSLAVWRESPEGRLAPDTEGLLGGRWRGRLSLDGRFDGDAVPFIPDEVAEITELGGVLDDFLPRLPARSLRQGEADSGRAGRIIRRLTDGPGGIQRFAWTIRPVTDTAFVRQDTVAIPLRRKVEEEGSMQWDPARGPLHWERRLTLTARVQPRGPIRRGINSLVLQRIRVDRVPGATWCQGGGFGPAPK